MDDLIKDYEEALLHIAWIVLPEKQAKRRLVFGLLELYPQGVPTIPIPEQEKKFKGFRLYYKRVKLPNVKSAIELYRKIKDANSIPVTIEDFCNEKFDLLDNIFCNQLQDVEIWPHFVVSNRFDKRNNQDNPFIADIWGNARTHLLMPEELDSTVYNYIVNENVGRWLEKYMGWNIVFYPELVGSVVLVLPNPYYSDIKIRLIHGSLDESQNYSNERIKLEFVPRHNANLDQLKVIPFEKTHFGISAELECSIKDNDCVIPSIGNECNEFGCLIKDNDGLLLDYREFHDFIRNAKVNFDIAGVIRKIYHPVTNEIIEITSYDKAIPINIGEEESPLGNRLTEAEIKRYRMQRVKDSGVRIFYNEHEAAKKYIIEQLSSARNSVTIIDPYAATTELFSYVMTIPNNYVSITLITSKMYLNEKSPISHSCSLGEELRQISTEYKKRTGVDIKILVMTGKMPAVHDRFLIIDDEAWLCGGSLNEIGNRMSCVIKLPDSSELNKRLDELEKKGKTITLDNWFINHNKNKSLQKGCLINWIKRVVRWIKCLFMVSKDK